MKKLADIKFIEIKGARVHNLKNIDLNIPLKKLVCFAGPSGSGKTSLAFHTLLTESKRRFVNSFPNSIKFFADRPAAVDVDQIFPVLPVFGLPQINPIAGSRAVVSDIMRLTDTLQNLYFNYSKELCPTHDLELIIKPIGEQFKDQFKGLDTRDVVHILADSNEYPRLFGESFFPPRSFNLKSKTMSEFNQEDQLWEVLRFKWDSLKNLEEKWIELKLDKIRVNLFVWHQKLTKPKLIKIELKKGCPACDFLSIPAVSVSAFSPYSALGACSECNGYGAKLVYDDQKTILYDRSIQEGGLKLLNYSPFHEAYLELLKVLKRHQIPLDVPVKKLPKTFFKILNVGEARYPGYDELKRYLESKKYRPSVRIYIRNLQKEEPCLTCSSSRLNYKIHHYKMKFGDKFLGLSQLMKLTVEETQKLFLERNHFSSPHEKQLIFDVREKLNVAIGMGLNHLQILRKAKSLSAGEYQRLLLIKYLSFKGTDSLFILDEPSLGLSKDELTRLLKGIREIINQGNTVIVIDHSEFLQKASDHIVVMGPGSGKSGGEILYQGRPEIFYKDCAVIEWKTKKKQSTPDQLIEVFGASIFGKTYPDFSLPVNQFTWVTGSSGTGKTSALIRVMANELYRKINGEYLEDYEYKIQSLKTKAKFEDVIVISSELNRFTSRSSVGTITELSSSIRKHFLKLPISKSMKLKEGHLSGNSELGMCPKCEGKGSLTIEMQYLEDIVLECEDCKGLKIRPIYANISDGFMTVAEAYNLPLSQVLERIELTPKFRRVWEYLKILNLDYLSLDRTLTSLSGGEKQRIYLLSKLLKNIQHSLIIFENISFGLSEREVQSLGIFLQDLVQLKNTIVVIDSSQYFSNLASWKLEFSSKEIRSVPLK